MMNALTAIKPKKEHTSKVVTVATAATATALLHLDLVTFKGVWFLGNDLIVGILEGRSGIGNSLTVENAPRLQHRVSIVSG